MKKLLGMLLLITALPLLGGCADPASLLQLPTGDIVSSATDRWGSWERVRQDEEKTKQEVAKAEKAKAELEQVRAASRENVQITINSHEELQTYALARANDNLAEANRILGTAVEALSGRGSVYKDLPSTPMPKGAFAEGIEATGDAVAKVANTPVALVTGAGLAAKWIIGKANAGAPNQFNLADGDLNAKGSFNELGVAAGNESPVSIPLAVPEANPVYMGPVTEVQ